MSGRWQLLKSCAAMLGVGAMLAPAAWGQQAQGRAVRLSSVDGQVQLSQGGTALADHALVNTPLFEGTRIATGDDGRAEVQFEDGSVARIAPNSSMTLTALQPGGDTKVALDSGMGYFEIEGGGGQGSAMRVSFDDSVVTAKEFTVIRVRMDQPPGELAVFSGDAHLDEAAGTVQVDVRGGESVTLNANDPAAYQLAESVEPDSWDAWNSDRDQALSAAESSQTPATAGMADSNNPAWGDLNENGTWYNTPDQGYVWSPYEASDSGWDPYGDGYWVDQPASGYMWVSAEPWGYLPYQCGAWSYYSDFGWGWAPGVCQPWWFGGAGWGLNIGDAPRWYRHPVRPNPPRGHEPRTVIAGGGGRPPIRIRPVIAVNRRLQPPSNTYLPPRAKGTPVTIGGNRVEPLRPEPVHARGGPAPVMTRGPRPAPPANSIVTRPVYTPSRNTYRPGQNEPAPANGLASPWPRSGAHPAPGMTYHPEPVGPRPAAPSYRAPSASRPSSPAPRSAPAPRAAPAPSAPRSSGPRR